MVNRMVANTMIKYLLKFVKEKEHARTLLDGALFMRPACYYHRLELGQGDTREAALSHKSCIFRHCTVPHLLHVRSGGT